MLSDGDYQLGSPYLDTESAPLQYLGGGSVYSKYGSLFSRLAYIVPRGWCFAFTCLSVCLNVWFLLPLGVSQCANIQESAPTIVRNESVIPAVFQFERNWFYEDNPLRTPVHPLLRLQTAAFRLIASAAYRAFRAKHWCWEVSSDTSSKNISAGRSYKFEEFRSFTLHLLDLYILLQFDRACGKELLTFRALVLTHASAPQTNGLPDLSWWEDEFLPSLIDSFSCGFNEKLPDGFENFLPRDIRRNFHNSTRNILPKVWRLTRGYVMSVQKQRERPERQQDFDVSLYVPFLGKYIGRDYPDWMLMEKMRVGYPTYNGPNAWYFFHVVANRLGSLDDTLVGHSSLCHLHRRKAFAHFISMFRFYVLAGQACPACREHFLTRVSINDELHEKYGWPSTESNIYPIEWLFLGHQYSQNMSAGILEQKLATISPELPESALLFVWKLHNAVTSSVTYGKECRVLETTDVEPWRCREDHIPRMGRAWPFALRFEFWVGDGPKIEGRGGAWGQTRGNLWLWQAAVRLDKLDGRHFRDEYWPRRSNESNVTHAEVSKLLHAIEDFDRAFLASGILQHEYDEGSSFAGPIVCDAPLEELPQFSDPVFNWTPAPAECLLYV